MDYLKLFQTHQEYETFVSGGTMLRPNVSHCVSENEVHYNPIAIMTVRYNVTDASNPTQLYTYISEEGITVNGALMFDKVVIDGTEVSIADLDAASGKTQFSVGEHTAKYTLKDPTFIGGEVDEQTGMPTKTGAMFLNCTSITSVEIPNSVSTVGGNAFYGCSGLTSVAIPNSVTSIGDYAFSGYDSQITSVTIGNSVTSIGDGAFQGGNRITIIIVKATIPPVLVGYPINTNVDTLKIYVPAESVNAYKSANGWSEVANKIQAIPTT